MADTGNGMAGLFDFQSLSDMVGAAVNGADAAIAGKQRVLDVAADETRALEKATAAHNRLTTQAVEKIQAVNSHAKQEVDWAQGGILGNLQQIGASILDPGNYTQAGRAAQMDVIQATLQSGNLVLDSAARMGEARLKSVEAEVASDTFSGESAYARLQTRVGAITLASQGLAATETMRLQNLSKMEPQDIKSSLLSPALAAAGSIAIGGYKYTKVELQELDKANTMRATLASMTPLESDPAYASIMAARNKLILGTYSYEELQTLQANGNQMPDGSIVDAMELSTAIELAKVDRQTKIQTEVEGGSAMKALPTAMTTTANRIKQFESYATKSPNSQIALGLAAYREGLQTIQGLNFDPLDTTGIGQTVAAKQLAALDDNFNKIVYAEAATRAGGDEQLTEIIRAQLYNEPVNPQLVSDYVVRRYGASKGFGQAFDSGDATLLKAEIDANYAQLVAENKGPYGLDRLNESDLKPLREKAAAAGLDSFKEKKGAYVVSSIPKMVFQRKDNPLVAAGMSLANYDQISRQATSLARSQLMANSGIKGEWTPDAAFDMIKAGRYAELGITPEQAANLAQLQNQQGVIIEYDMLESMQPGLGLAHTRWMQTHVGDLIERATNTTLVGATPTQNLFAPMFIEQGQEQGADLISLYVGAAESVSQRAQGILAAGYAQAQNPAKMFPAILTMTEGISNEHKNKIMTTLVHPLIQQATEKKLGPDEVAGLLSQALDKGFPSDPSLTASGRKMLKQLPTILGNYNTLAEIIATPEAYREAARNGVFGDFAAGMPTTVPTPEQYATAHAMFGTKPKKPLPLTATGDGPLSVGTGKIVPPSLRDSLESPGQLGGIMQVIRENGWDQ